MPALHLHGAQIWSNLDLGGAAGTLLHIVADAEAALLDLDQAAAESRYSPSQLRRLIQLGTVRNAGRPRSPRIRRGDLPRKPGLLTAAERAADVRQRTANAAPRN